MAGVVREPATRLAFWIHWICSFWPMLFTLMWGYPFLLNGLGYPQPVASGLFTVLVLAGLPFGPLIGLLSRRAPLQRTNLALLLSLTCAVPWAAILLWPGRAPIWLLVVLMIGMAASGPGSGIGFDIARAANPLRHIGTATGVVIVGGFSAVLINVWVIGVILDLMGGYSLTSFRWAMATQFLFYAIGIVGAYTERTRATEARPRAGRPPPDARGRAAQGMVEPAGPVADLPLAGVRRCADGLPRPHPRRRPDGAGGSRPAGDGRAAGGHRRPAGRRDRTTGGTGGSATTSTWWPPRTWRSARWRSAAPIRRRPRASGP